MINGAVSLFKEKGFHRTTTREIARAAGFSIGTLYEYIREKEDVLYLVCDRFYDHVSEKLEQDIDVNNGTVEGVKRAIAHFIRVVDEMQDEVLVMYQEAKSLSKDALPYVLRKENDMAELFEKMIQKCVDNGSLDIEQTQIPFLAQSIVVQGEMWAFRRWALQKIYTIDEFIELQTDFLIAGLNKGSGEKQTQP